jgi:transposase
MGQKGDRAAKEPLAIRMYAEGKSIEAIAAELDISATTLRIWKSQSKAPDAEIDEWDRARQQKRNMSRRLKDVYEDQVEYIESLRPNERTAPMIDALSKMGALVEKHEIRDRASAAAEDVAKIVKDNGLSDKQSEQIRKKILGIV